jgi:hypothetical protein
MDLPLDSEEKPPEQTSLDLTNNDTWYTVEVCRTEYQYYTFTVLAADRKEAVDAAINQAYNQVFPLGKHAEYEVTSVEEE